MKKFQFILSALVVSVPFSCLNAQIPPYVPQGGLELWMPFSGNANDHSTNANHGQINGASLTTDRFGSPNSAYSFDGDDWIETLHDASIDFNGADNYTISLWFEMSSSHQLGSLIDKWNSGYQPYPYSIRIDADSNPKWIRVNRYIGGTPQDSTTVQRNMIDESMVAIDTSYHHLVATYEQDSITVYYDGVKVRSEPNYMTSNAFSNADNMFIGRVGTAPNRFFNGTIDDIGIWSRSLTPAEIENLYTGGICFETITVTDTLIINSNLTSFDPVTYQNQIKVYPNPTGSEITIDFGSNYGTLAGYSLRIDNSAGQTVFSSPVTQQTYSSNLASWSGLGLHMLYLIDNQSRVVDVRKIIVK